MTERNAYFNGEMIARKDLASGSVHYLYHDQIGSARVVTNATGSIQDDLDYYPFGGTVAFSQSSGNIYDYTGYEHDAESGTEHAWFRNLSGTLGRYLRPDPYNLSYNPLDPQSLNRYAYLANRPLNMTDPWGLICQWDDGSSDDDPSDGGDDEATCLQQGGTWDDGGGGYWTMDSNGVLFVNGTVYGGTQTVSVSADPDNGGAFTIYAPMNTVSLMFQQSGFFVSTADMKLPFHKAALQLRSDDSACSPHVLLNVNTDGSTSVSIHTDLINPFIPSAFPNSMILLHGALDVVPDMIQQVLPSMPTGSDGCDN